MAYSEEQDSDEVGVRVAPRSRLFYSNIYLIDSKSEDFCLKVLQIE